MSTDQHETKRSNFLTAFCFISLLISIGFIIGSFLGLNKMDSLIAQQMETFQTLSKQMNVSVENVPGYGIAVMAIESVRSPVSKGTYALIALSFLSIIAIVIMLRGKKIGFYIFTFANIIMCAGMVYTYMCILMPRDFEQFQVYFLYGAIVSFLQIAIFAFQLKNLR